MNKRLFLQGTLIPDIRYLGMLEREETHLPLKNLSMLEKDPPFAAGMKFHNFVVNLAASLFLDVTNHIQKFFTFIQKKDGH